MKQKLEKREYQSTAVKKTVSHLKKNDRAQLHLPPGSGKTVISLLIKEQIKPNLTVVFVPTVILIYQQLMSWKKFRSTSFQALSITVGRMSDADKAILSKMGIKVPTSTSERDIKSFVSRKGSRVIFCTYKSAPKIAKVLKACNTEADLSIFDEAHWIAGPKDKVASVLLHDESFPCKKRLFVTATPRTVSETEHHVIFNAMDNADLFGEVAYEMTVKSAIEQNILVPYQVIAMVVRKEELARLKVKCSKTERAALVALTQAIEEFDLAHGLSFHNTTSGATRFSNLVAEAYPEIETSAITWGISGKERTKALGKAENAEHSLITNVRVLGEGYDYSALDYIVMVDPKSSVSTIVQNIGRVLRSHKGKTIGSIVIPIIKDGEQSADEAVMNSSFDTICNVATALAIKDKTLASLISASSRYPTVQSEEIATFVAEHVVVGGIDPDDLQTIDKVKKSIEIVIVDIGKGRATTDWSARADAFEQWVKENDKLPTSYKNDPASLNQLYLAVQKRRPHIPECVLKRLLPLLDSHSKGTTTRRRWDSFYRRALKFSEAHGRLPSIPDDRATANIVILARNNKFPSSVKGTNIEKRFRALIEKYNTKPRRKTNWDLFHRDLVQFTEDHGLLPTRAIADRLLLQRYRRFCWQRPKGIQGTPIEKKIENVISRYTQA